MNTIPEQAPTSCDNRLEASQPIEKPNSSSKITKWNDAWIFSNPFDRSQKHFILDNMRFVITKFNDEQFEATLSYYITSKGWKTGTTLLPGIQIVLKDSQGVGFADWPIDNIQVDCKASHLYQEHKANFNLYAFENIFIAERDTNEGNVYKC